MRRRRLSFIIKQTALHRVDKTASDPSPIYQNEADNLQTFLKRLQNIEFLKGIMPTLGLERATGCPITADSCSRTTPGTHDLRKEVFHSLRWQSI